MPPAKNGSRFGFRRLFKLLSATAHNFVAIDAEQRAASFAYYALFSFFPLLALLITLGSFFFELNHLVSAIDRYFPLDHAGQQFVWKMVTDLQNARGGVSVVSILILMWSSLRFFQALVRAVNRAWHTVEIPWWQIPMKNLAMVAILASALLLGLLAPAILQGINTYADAHLPETAASLSREVLTFLRYGIGSAVLFYSFTMLYMFAPRIRVRFIQVWLPALVVTITLQALQVFFVHYLPRMVNYNAIYGSVGALMFLLMWIYLSGLLIIAGACLCAAAADAAPSMAAGSDSPQ